ncbi:hypothetical protein KC341_g84 [Hortaea werneckii]|nr:hypothetical protein KC341_g84 [Hortaea werneckii]
MTSTLVCITTRKTMLGLGKHFKDSACAKQRLAVPGPGSVGSTPFSIGTAEAYDIYTTYRLIRISDELSFLRARYAMAEPPPDDTSRWVLIEHAPILTLLAPRHIQCRILGEEISRLQADSRDLHRHDWKVFHSRIVRHAKLIGLSISLQPKDHRRDTWSPRHVFAGKQELAWLRYKLVSYRVP